MSEPIVLVRAVLTTSLIYKVYEEAGQWTALSIGLIYVSIEIITFTILKIKERL